MTMAFSASHTPHAADSELGLVVFPVRYPIFPFPLITSITDWDHSQKLAPFSLCKVIWREVPSKAEDGREFVGTGLFVVGGKLEVPVLAVASSAMA